MGQEVQYLDCDVEEPNGHIFLKPQIEHTQEATVGVPDVDTQKCDGCGNCGRLCQYSAIVCLKEMVMTFDPLCHSCGGCMLVCPTGAITEKQRPIGFIDLGAADGVKFAQGRLNVGDVRTPSLIRRLKQKAVDQGAVIMDAPPGTSCPVIEAVKGADLCLLVTEPTPFGLNDLKLAVDMVAALKLRFAVVINRSDSGDDRVHRFCLQEGIEIAMELSDDRRIAEAYSAGKMIIDELPEYKDAFSGLYERILKNLEAGTDETR
jgi:MinD superfamily P-loop ATPase